MDSLGVQSTVMDLYVYVVRGKGGGWVGVQARVIFGDSGGCIGPHPRFPLISAGEKRRTSPEPVYGTPPPRTIIIPYGTRV